MIPLSLYVHIPWCERKCPYCDFNSHEAKNQVNESAYISALLDDLAVDLKLHQQAIEGRGLSSIFIGGGTPSLFSAESISTLLNGIRAQIDFDQDIEITLEANPGSAEAGRFIGFHQAGVNRLSIGVQSFNDTHLKKLGRVHNGSNALKAAEFAQNAGFDNFNLDLMFGLPEQSLEQAQSDLEHAIALQPTHLSCYQLTIEPNTLFHHKPPATPDDEALWEMQTALQQQLGRHGFNQYEVSAYAQPDRRCRHNLNYWEFGDYLGIGAGAHGKISSYKTGVHRSWKIKHPANYQRRIEQKQDPAGGRNQVESSALPFEFMLNALRLTHGFDTELFSERTFLPIDRIALQLDKHQDQRLIELSDGELNFTSRGKSLIDTMLQDYLV